MKGNHFEQFTAAATGGDLHSVDLRTVQVNVGLVCNQSCRHCHLAASPARRESMDWPTMERVLDAISRCEVELVDITGGAPELNPNLRRFIEAVGAAGRAVQVRTNLTVLLEPQAQGLIEFFSEREVRLVASMPCYLERNVEQQRGPAAYERSIEALRRLNEAGYGLRDQLPLHLVHNPTAPSLPPDQAVLEADYRRELTQRFDIAFTRLVTITNMPIGRFDEQLRASHEEDRYMQMLKEAFNPATLDGLMCRRQISIAWDGTLYDCDFNLALNRPVDCGAFDHVSRFDPQALAHRRIATGEHCFGCTAGCGSSCAGALV